MAVKFYAVKAGRKPGIYRTWDECKAQVQGYSGAIYKSFSTQQAAMDFIKGNAQVAAPADNPPETGREGELIAYVDGSYCPEMPDAFSYGVVILQGDQVVRLSKRITDPVLAAMRNVAGEIKGAEAAMSYAFEQGLPITICHDYEGIARWCLGEWKTNLEGTKAYKAHYDACSRTVRISFYKVAGHTGVTYNEEADRLAKEALGL